MDVAPDEKTAGVAMMRVAFEQRLLENEQSSLQREDFFIVRQLLSEHFTSARWKPGAVLPRKCVWSNEAAVAARGIIFLLTGLLLGGCMQATTSDRPPPVSDANFTARDRQQLANPPYQQASIPHAYQRQIVQFHRKEAPGSIVVDTDARFLYYVLSEEKAIRYGVIVGEDAQAWSGVAKVGRKQEWPSWTPTEGEKRRLGPLPNYVEGGAHNPMGARGIYLYSDDKDTLYRIHGTNQPQWIGHAISSGCIRLTNEDVIDLYSRVKMGAIVVVLGPKQGDSRVASAAISRAN
jgi:lipoprotein-anchoring transpeptidase ErfK/SrfK